MKRQVSIDRARGVEVWVEMTPDGEFVFTEKQITHAREIAQHMDNHVRQDGRSSMIHVAEIPDAMVNELMRSGMWWDQAAMMKWLNDPDQRRLRTDGRKL